MQGPFYLDKIARYSINSHQHVLSPEKIKKLFIPENPDFSNARVITDIDSLYAVLKDTYSALNRADAHKTKESAPFFTLIQQEKSKETLRFMMRIIERDREVGRPYRLLDPLFLQKNLHYFLWIPDKTSDQNLIQAPTDGTIRLTHYALFHTQASRKKSTKQPCALYQLIDPSAARQFTKQEIMAGVLERPEHAHRVKPLAWVSREKCEDALMQGSLLVTFPDGASELFTVHTHNSQAYDKTIKNQKQQKRYWYFVPILHPQKFLAKIAQRADILCAGDIWSLGFGRLFILTTEDKESKKKSLRFAVLGDAGAAFTKNGYQLDIFAGLFASKEFLKKHIAGQPMFARARVGYAGQAKLVKS